MTAGNEYWLSLSNANDAQRLGAEAWDIPNGGPAVLRLATSGRAAPILAIADWAGNPSRSAAAPPPPARTPEPTSIMLFGSGILGLAGVLRRKLTR